MSNELLINFWDVKHGHATYMKTPNDRHIVIDLGTGTLESENSSFSPLLHLQEKYGVQQIDYCILTHPHMDHIDDILEFTNLPLRVFYRNKNSIEKVDSSKIKNSDAEKVTMLKRLNGNYTQSVNGTLDDPGIPNNYGGIRITNFSTNYSGDNLNNYSSVSVFEYLGFKIVIPGDNEKESWQELLEKPDFCSCVKNSDILLAAHHGRESGFYKEVVELINPRLTVISDSSKFKTSEIEDYSKLSRGKTVYTKKNLVKRNTLSTYYDGVITIRIFQGNDSKNRMYVSAKKSQE